MREEVSRHPTFTLDHTIILILGSRGGGGGHHTQFRHRSNMISSMKVIIITDEKCYVTRWQTMASQQKNYILVTRTNEKIYRYQHLYATV